MKYLVLLALVSCNTVDSSKTKIYTIREPFEYVIIGNNPDDFNRLAINHCNSPIVVQQQFFNPIKEEMSYLYFRCKVGRN